MSGVNSLHRHRKNSGRMGGGGAVQSKPKFPPNKVMVVKTPKTTTQGRMNAQMEKIHQQLYDK